MTVPPNTETEGAICPVTGVPISDTNGRGVRRFVSAMMLRNDDDLLLQLNDQHSQYAKGSKEDEYSRAAHNVRNAHSNPRNIHNLPAPDLTTGGGLYAHV